MKTYVISDIHGDMGRFFNMLTLINFNGRDTLYILGDVIDRGKYGIEILEYIMEQNNIFMVKGNHELLMQLSYTNDKFNIDTQSTNCLLWKSNGGSPTIKTLQYRRKKEQRKILYEYIESLPLFYDDIEVNGKIYYLVHGRPSLIPKEEYERILINRKTDEYSRLEDKLVWGRVEEYDNYFEDKTVVFGHTPTNNYQSNLPFKVWTSNKVNAIGIDCGCGFGGKVSGTRLACICLDTLEEFYI